MGMFLTSGQLGNIPTLRMWLILFQEWGGGMCSLWLGQHASLWWVSLR